MENQNGKVFIELSVNKRNIRVGEKLEIVYCIENLTDQAYRFSKLYYDLIPSLAIFNKVGEEFPRTSAKDHPLKIFPGIYDLYNLRPNKKKVFKWLFLVQKGTNEYGQGYFLFHKESETYIILGQDKQLFLRGVYAKPTDKVIKYFRTYFEISNLYQDSIYSSIIGITINE